MNGMKDLSNFMDDGDVSDTFVLFFPGKIHNNQINHSFIQIINFLLTVYLSVCCEMALLQEAFCP